MYNDVPAHNLPISQWTSACKDDRLMNHLLALFWTWDNMVEPSLFRPLFEDDLNNNNSTFCSPFLVNALLALSCVSRRHSVGRCPLTHCTVIYYFGRDLRQPRR